MSKVYIGTRVAYTRDFLRSTGQFTGDAPFLRGEVIDIMNLNQLRLALVKWDGFEEPRTINIKNLIPVNRIHLESV